MKDINLNILFEDRYLLAISKPAGLIVEKNQYEEDTLEDRVESYLWTKKPPFVGIVHRLDRVTSGVIIFAKKPSILKNLNRQFETRKIKKCYRALTSPCPAPNRFVLEHFHGKDLQKKKAIIKDHSFPGSKPCKLSYTVKNNMADDALVEVWLHTGRYHQIRAQLAHMGWPIKGDIKYGATVPYEKQGIALHAHKLQFLHPFSGDIIEIEAPVPF